MNTVRARIGKDDGAILVHVAVGLLMLIGVSAFAIDFGLFWLGRSQAQNSADAGALANRSEASRAVHATRPGRPTRGRGPSVPAR